MTPFRVACRVTGVVACGAVAVVLGVALVVLLSQRGTGIEGADCAVVFGSAVYGFDTPGPAMLRRVSTAVRLYHEERIQRLFFTGGKNDEKDQTEAEVMSRYATRQNVPVSVVVLEERARSTWENIAFTFPLAEDCATLVAISDGYHLGRIRLFAFAQGWGSIATIPADESPPRPQYIQSLLREIAAALYYLFIVPVAGDPRSLAS